MGNGPFIVVYLLKIVIFHGYVSLPEGTSFYMMVSQVRDPQVTIVISSH